jgi:hypothetical protein
LLPIHCIGSDEADAAARLGLQLFFSFHYLRVDNHVLVHLLPVGLFGGQLHLVGELLRA